VTQIIYAVSMDVMRSFINMVREKRLGYLDSSEIFKESSLFIYMSISLAGVSENRV